MSNDLLKELAENEGKMKALEDQANKHEQAARECRTERLVAKGRIAELHALINDARVVHAVNGALASAQAAQASAEASKTEAAAVLDQLKAKLAELSKPVE